LLDRDVPGKRRLDRAKLSLAGVEHPGREWKANGAIDARHSERRILDRLHERAATLGPALDPLFVKKVARQTVDDTHASRVLIRLRVEIVRGEVVASRNADAVQIALVARHSLTRVAR